MSNDFYHSAILPHARIFNKICRAYTNSQEDFEDYYQEVCLQIWKSRKNFKGKAEWSTWVYRVTLNVCLTLIRKKGVSIEDADGLTIEKDRLINDLYRAIRTLSEIDRAIILLYLEEMPYRVITRVMGTKITNVGVKINRIKEQS